MVKSRKVKYPEYVDESDIEISGNDANRKSSSY